MPDCAVCADFLTDVRKFVKIKFEIKKDKQVYRYFYREKMLKYG